MDVELEDESVPLKDEKENDLFGRRYNDSAIGSKTYNSYINKSQTDTTRKAPLSVPNRKNFPDTKIKIPDCSRIASLHKKIAEFVSQEDMHIDDLYDKLEELYNYLEKIVLLKTDDIWSDTDFEKCADILFIIAYCQIRTKHYDGEVPKVDSTFDQSYTSFKSYMQKRFRIERKMVNCRSDKYSSIYKMFNEARIVVQTQTLLDCNMRAEAEAYCKNPPKSSLKEISNTGQIYKKTGTFFKIFRNFNKFLYVLLSNSTRKSRYPSKYNSYLSSFET